MASTPFTDALLPSRRGAIAPDGSQVRFLVRLPGGSMAHFELGPGEVSRPTQHRTVSEAWYILQGLGRMWRRQDGTERTSSGQPGSSRRAVLNAHRFSAARRSLPFGWPPVLVNTAAAVPCSTGKP